MRTLHLYCHRAEETLVEGIDGPNPVTTLTAVQEDTLRILVHNLAANTGTPNFPYFVEQPFAFTSMRVAIGLVDQAPRRGTFQLRVDGQTTDVLTWPAASALATPALIATWKATILAALKALSNVADDAIIADNPEATPAHFLDFAWTNPADTRPIELVNNRLFPRTRCVAVTSQTDAGLTQRLKLIQFPYVAGVDFESPFPPVATVEPSITGAAGRNEEQILIVPAGAQGSLSLAWSGASTGTLDVATLNAPALSAALNAIVADGTTNPSFSVAARSSPDGSRRWSIQFIGPLAGVDQTLLTVAMHDQIARPYVQGDLPLRGNFGIEQALNGQPSVNLTLELNIDDNESYLVTLALQNSLTDPDTVEDIENAGGIITIETEVIIDDSTADPFTTAQAGLEFTLPVESVGSASVTLTHPDWGRQVGVQVFHQTDVAGDVWSEVRDTEYFNSSASNTATVVTLPGALVNDATSIYHYARWKVRLIDPDTTVALNAHQHTFDEVRASLPSGETLAARLAAIATALGMIGGSIRIPAANIDGTLTPAQIDASALATVLVNQPSFSTTLATLYASNQTLVTALINQFAGNAAFTTALTTLLTGDTTIVQTIGEQLSGSTDFAGAVRELVFEILQGNAGALPAGTTLFRPEPFELVVPAPQQIAAVPTTRTVTATEETTVTGEGGSSSKLSRLVDSTLTTPAFRTVFPALSPALTGLTDGGTISGPLPRTDAGTSYYTVSGSADSRGAGRRRGRRFTDGQRIAYGAGHWYEVVLIGSTHYAVECECTPIQPIPVALFAGSQFLLTFQPLLQLAGNVTGSLALTAEFGAVSGGGYTWSEIFTHTARLSSVAQLSGFSVKATKAANGTLTGEYKIGSQATAFTPAASAFAVRVRAGQFTPATAASPEGSLTLRLPAGAASASVIAL